jgi:hypothetical protein
MTLDSSSPPYDWTFRRVAWAILILTSRSSKCGDKNPRCADDSHPLFDYTYSSQILILNPKEVRYAYHLSSYLHPPAFRAGNSGNPGQVQSLRHARSGISNPVHPCRPHPRCPRAHDGYSAASGDHPRQRGNPGGWRDVGPPGHRRGGHQAHVLQYRQLETGRATCARSSAI